MIQRIVRRRVGNARAEMMFERLTIEVQDAMPLPRQRRGDLARDARGAGDRRTTAIVDTPSRRRRPAVVSRSRLTSSCVSCSIARGRRAKMRRHSSPEMRISSQSRSARTVANRRSPVSTAISPMHSPRRGLGDDLLRPIGVLDDHLEAAVDDDVEAVGGVVLAEEDAAAGQMEPLSGLAQGRQCRRRRVIGTADGRKFVQTLLRRKVLQGGHDLFWRFGERLTRELGTGNGASG